MSNIEKLEAEWDDVPDMCTDFDAFAESAERERSAVTWTCHVCGDERPDQFIGVRIRDISANFNLPPKTIQENIRYCLDRADCARRAVHTSFIKKDGDR